MYEIRIQRLDESISLDEWKTAVSTVAKVRLQSSDVTAINPATGETITFPLRDGDAEVYFENEGTWHYVFSWRPKGHVTFRGTNEFMDETSALRAVVRALAAQLGARILGEEDEEY